MTARVYRWRNPIVRACLLSAAITAPAPAEPQHGAEDATATRGARLYRTLGCDACHGGVGQGALHSGPRVAPDPLPLAAFAAVIRRPAGEMPAYSSAILNDADLAAIHAFLASIATPAESPATDYFP